MARFAPATTCAPSSTTALAVRTLIDGLHSRYDKDVVEQAAIAGALNPATMNDTQRATEAAAYVARRLDIIAEETERGWTGQRLAEGGLLFERTVRGVKESVRIDAALVDSADARRLDQYAAQLQEVYGTPPAFRRKDDTATIAGPRALLASVFATGRKGLTLQRYKGLGEMNAGAAVGNDARPERPLAAAGEGQRRHRRGRSVLAPDGRGGRAAQELHPGQRAQRREPGRLTPIRLHYRAPAPISAPSGHGSLPSARRKPMVNPA